MVLAWNRFRDPTIRKLQDPNQHSPAKVYVVFVLVSTVAMSGSEDRFREFSSPSTKLGLDQLVRFAEATKQPAGQPVRPKSYGIERFRFGVCKPKSAFSLASALPMTKRYARSRLHARTFYRIVTILCE